MMPPGSHDAILKRIGDLLAVSQTQGSPAKYIEAFQGTLNLVRAAYGAGSSQEASLVRGVGERGTFAAW